MNTTGRLALLLCGTITVAPLAAQTTRPPPLDRATAIKTAEAQRAAVLTEREIALARLRQAAIEQERLRIIEDMRTHARQRMEQQREIARQVRDDFRQVRRAPGR
ncbi:MAG: hypothetical protein ACREH8_18665 [Opitutaceae bacterium]